MNNLQAGVPPFRLKGGEGGYCPPVAISSDGAILIDTRRTGRPLAQGMRQVGLDHSARRQETTRTVELEAEIARLRKDLDERKRTAEHQDLLMHELSHRMKNTLVLVQAIATQTMRTAGSVDEARQSFSTRMVALGKAHDLLTRPGTTSVGIADVVHAALDLHGGLQGRINVAGPALQLKPKAALALSLMLHELATNAAKYGALSGANGSVEIAWSLTDDGRMALCWTEQGGPAVAPPTRRGFGSRLIERSFAGEFDGNVHVVYAPSGVICTLAAPLERLQA